MSADRLFAVKEEMEKAEARRLQPYFVRSFFMKAFEQLGGSIYPREAGRFEITHVPTSIRERDRRITGRNRREQEPVLKRYEPHLLREGGHPAHRQAGNRPRRADASRPSADARRQRLAPGAARQPAAPGNGAGRPGRRWHRAWLLFLLTHEVKSGDGRCSPSDCNSCESNPDGSDDVRRLGTASRPGAACRFRATAA